LERGIFQQSANFEFRLQTDSGKNMDLQELVGKGFGKQERLLFRLVLNSWAIAPSISIVPDRRVERGKILEIFNPLPNFPLEYPIHKLIYEFEFETEKGDHIKSDISIDPTIYLQKAMLALPFSGTCLVTDGHDFLSHHRRNFPLTHPLMRQIGIVGNNSRFAYDFVLLDNELRMFKNPPLRNEDFFCWGKPVLSPGGGRIASVANDFPDNPLYAPPPFDLQAHIKNPDAAMESHMGNYAIIDHGSDEFSILAHMQKGSVLVGAGDKVSEGEQIGRIGNSGDSGSPHIHYQLQNGRSLRKSEGLPSSFQGFDLILGDTTKRVEDLCPNTGMIIRRK
jgi:hypothetical protein